MLLAMLILAAACVVIGVFPRFFVNMSLAAATAGGLVQGAVSVKPFVQLTGNITMGAAIFFGLVLLVALLADQGEVAAAKPLTEGVGVGR